MTSFKIYFSDNNIRRISSDVERPTYEQFTELLMGLYPNDYHPELYVRWRDEDGDLIIASSEAEWTEMLNAIHERPIKLYVTEGMTPYFKDGPPAEPQYFYAENEEPEEKEKPELLERLKNSVPKSLQNLFKGGRILPDNIPKWLKEAVQIKNRIGNDVDLDVDIPKLWHAMHTKAMECLQDAKNTALIQQGKKILEEMLEIIPKHAVTLYNLSCAESLLGNTKEAVKRLRDAVVAGYRNFEHMMKDQDLENIRDTSEFQDLKTEFEGVKLAEECDDLPELANFGSQVVNPPPTPAVELSDDESDWSTESSSSDDSDWTHVDGQMDEDKPLLQSAVEIEAEMAESTPVPEPIPEKWKESLELLKTMGFSDAPKCIVLLEKHNGDLVAMIEELLMM